MKFIIPLLFTTIILIFSSSISCGTTDSVDEEVELEHSVNSFVLGITLVLLLLICLFTYLFQSYHFHYLPEPSVCLICGLVVGIILRYSNHIGKLENDTEVCTLETPNIKHPPLSLEIQMNNETYEYKYVGQGEQQVLKEDLLAEKVLFSPELFFYLFLPPIMFNCGMRLQKRYFFRNFGTILLMALLGTAVTLFIFSAIVYVYIYFDSNFVKLGFDFPQSMLFGAIICSTDPVSVLSTFTQLGVDKDLYSIILGESALNDAVSLIAQRTINVYLIEYANSDKPYGAVNFLKSFGLFFGVLLGSFTIGASFAVINSIITKATEVRKFPLIETAIFMLLSYSSFLATEMCGMIGIVGVLFCGIFQGHYTLHNCSYESKIQIDKLVELINFFAENFVFCYMGITVFVFNKHVWNLGFIVWSFMALMIGRAVTVYVLCFFANLRRTRKISFSFQHVIFIAGLKGAISFALALENVSTEIRRLLLSTTIILVLITVFIFGGFISKVMSLLKIPMQGHNDPKTDPEHEPEQITVDYFYTDETWIARKWQNINDRYIFPFLTVDGPPYKQIFLNIYNKIRGRDRTQNDAEYSRFAEGTPVAGSQMLKLSSPQIAVPHVHELNIFDIDSMNDDPIKFTHTKSDGNIFDEDV